MGNDAARVVVIGGGITGCSVALHLAEAGWTDVLLVEKATLTAGSTCHAAGLVTAFNPSATMMGFRRYSIELYERLGVFERVGSLRLASSPDQLRELERTASRARGIGLDAGVIGPEEARALMPAISPEALYGAVHLTGDGHLDPHTATHAVADAARSLGVRIRTGVRVTGFELGRRREIRRVLTDAGPIDTELVVNAAGMWAPQVAAMVGAFIPSTPVDHQHIALKAVPGAELPRDMPCFRDPDNLVYGKSEHGGMVFGGYEADPPSRWEDGVPVGPRGPAAAARLRAVRPADGRRDPAVPVPGRRRGGPARLPPRRDDPRRQPAPRAGTGRPRVLGRGRALAQRLRRRRRHRPGDGRLDHGRRSGRRHRPVPGVAVRAMSIATRGSPPASRARPTATTTGCATRSTPTSRGGRSDSRRSMGGSRTPAPSSGRRPAGNGPTTTSRGVRGGAPAATSDAWGWGEPPWFARVCRRGAGGPRAGRASST